MFIGPNYKVADVARAIAIAVNSATLDNTQDLPNGLLDQPIR